MHLVIEKGSLQHIEGALRRNHYSTLREDTAVEPETFYGVVFASAMSKTVALSCGLLDSTQASI